MTEHPDLACSAEQAATLINQMISENESTIIETEEGTFNALRAEASGPYLRVTCSKRSRDWYGEREQHVELYGAVRDLKARFISKRTVSFVPSENSLPTAILSEGQNDEDIPF